MYFDYERYKAFYTADFETSTAAWGVDKARVWLWDICDCNLQHKTGTTLESFINHISRFDGCLFSFHNLAYDGCYILDYLLRKGYTFTNSKRPCRGEFTTIISPQGMHYAYEVHWYNGKTCTFNDSFKHNSQSIRDLAKTYNLPIKKGEIDYDMFREEGYLPTDEEIDYIHNDTEIIMRVLLDDFAHGFTKFTESGNSKKFFKNSIGTKEDYERLLPELSDEEDAFVRKAYRGGYCYLKEQHFNKMIEDGMISVDINSMYPATMLHRPLPYGLPIKVDGRAEDSEFYRTESPKCNKNEPLLYVQHFYCAFELKPNRVPTIARKAFRTFAIKDLYLKSSGFKICEMWLTNVDMELMFENYDVWDIEYIDAYIFRSKCGREITHDEAATMELDDIIREDGKGAIYYAYLQPWRMEKEHTKGGRRNRAKKQQNIGYGWQATSRVGDLVMPVIGKHDTLEYRKYEGEPRTGGYIPIATFITAWSRHLLITNILNNYERFVYCDTDSMYLLGKTAPNIPIHPSLYGYFKIEHYIDRAKFLGCKRYIYETAEDDEDGKRLIVKCCGAPSSVVSQMTFENFVPYDPETGAGKFDGKISQRIVKGGKHLLETTYKLVF